MPFKLISYIIVLVFLVTFIGLNLGNTSDVSLWFSEKGQFSEVPIVISFLIMYILGALSVVPYIIGKQFKSLRKKKIETKELKEKEKKEKAAKKSGRKKLPEETSGEQINTEP